MVLCGVALVDSALRKVVLHVTMALNCYPEFTESISQTGSSGIMCCISRGCKYEEDYRSFGLTGGSAGFTNFASLVLTQASASFKLFQWVFRGVTSAQALILL